MLIVELAHGQHGGNFLAAFHLDEVGNRFSTAVGPDVGDTEVTDGAATYVKALLSVADCVSGFVT